ncbi:isoleucine--tRNA ligase [Granulicella sp. 5B5]|uniref:isoleucine--tRNA ligase n=1 Tax=Granulicella sp. 5B5 TaxID=1617967 RepID=UPI0015F4246F|nr:isoleucine--tRNA ligase [Granulicella sp. 5B5]QMV17451.1 isoleucine--tRNA ligase [Granulicella sp. 5B5]
MSESKSLKSTLNLPKTEFAMKANLPQNEPVRLKSWEESGLYQQIRTARAGAPKYILHDGPPYANGAIHLGHALNKCIKDFVVKTKTMAGFDAPYVPGWDCHGLPIEIKVDEQLGGKKLEMDPVAVRQACREYAAKYIDLQRSQFKRLGVFGRWEKPYQTMDFEYEAKILETFYGFYEKGFVYKGLRPVYWCSHDRTALAEAEVEYAMHTSPSVYVRYKLTSAPEKIDPKLRGKSVYTIIWTTTPWTLPASMAVAFGPEVEYVALDDGADVYIVAEALAEQVREACTLLGDLKSAKVIAKFAGAKLDRVTFAHPFLEREVLGVNADYVTTDQGTGAVHTAPSHGPDDFATGQKYDLPLTCNVDAQGKLRNYDGQPFDGLFVQKANSVIKQLVAEKSALMGEFDLVHSYPHCWRCHKPLIFRATEQWFIGMETPVLSPKADGQNVTFRERALEEISRVTWDPEWGEERISNMIATRPDWCISRQRIWGVPIAVFLCERCHEPLNDPAINKSVVKLFAKKGADAWYSQSVAELLPKGTVCPGCGEVGKPSEFRKEMDILDVWFESGASWHAVLEVEPELRFPADLYTEGGDQHRGWFHSSLLSSVGMCDAAPYKYVATSGWTLDEQGRAFSKSLGNGVDPVDVANRLGGEIIRLWVASVDFREDVAASENLMQRVSENYRKLRNTLRFLLSNLEDFDPSVDAVAWSALQPLDQYILARTAELDAAIRKAYDEFEFHRAYQALNEFTNSDLSALYLDVVKDRLYTFAPKSAARRSAQTAMWRIAEALTRLIAPILSFTADEVWQYLPKMDGRAASVHLALFPEVLEIVPGSVAGIEKEWEQLLAVRSLVMIELEAMRAAKSIGKSLEASVAVIATEGSDEAVVLKKYEAALAEFFNVSQATVQLVGASAQAKAVLIETQVADGAKCGRCWRVVPDVGSDARWPEVCSRCAEALDAIGFEATAGGTN